VPIIDKDLDPKANRQWIVTIAPTSEPITVAETKLFARIDGSDEDTLIEGFIQGVREATETYLGRALMTQTIRMVMDWWPGEMVELPQPPLISVTSIQTIDEDDTATTYDSDNYFVITEAIPGRIVIKQGASVPENTDRYYAGFRITYQAGYGDADDVPQQIKEAMKLWATAVYENRAITTEPPPEARNLLNLYRVIKY
jgi:uncharacterized phiE125 gp8 family phage protein